MECSYDLAVIGGSIAGASTAYLLKRRNPALRIVIIEKSLEFDRKVGESTSEVSACFLTRVLNLAQHLGHEQISKTGLRFWFYRDSSDCFTRCAEIGPKSQTRLPTFQLDRSKLDPKVLEMAVAAGCELWRPARLQQLELGGEDKNSLVIKTGDETRTISARWVIDGSGRAAVVARKLKILKPLTSHPTNAVWARFRHTADLDGTAIWQEAPGFTEPCWTMRQWATNHLMGYGWWCWIIPLKGGDFSVGVVYDSRIYQLPPGPTLGDRLKAHLLNHPLGRRLFENAQFIEHDVRAFSALPYFCEQTIGDGWALVGDAAGFLDPLYSPGLDFISYTASGVAEIVGDALAGVDITKTRREYNERFQQQFHTWFQGVYKDKYYYIGDAELMSVAFLLDVGAYFIGPVRQAYGPSPRRYSELPYAGTVGQMFGRVMRTYNRRLAAMARRRVAAGVYGAKNLDRRMLLPGFTPDAQSFKLIFKGLCKWLALEWQNLFLRIPARDVSNIQHLAPVPRQQL
jgi:flavin-dependent dehydrogenase